MARKIFGSNVIYFNSVNDALFRLRSIGYNNSNEHRDLKYIRTKQYGALHYVVSGSGKIILRGKEHKVEAGMFFYAPPYEPMNYHHSENESWSYYFFALYPDSLIKIHEILGLTNDSPTAVAKNPKLVMKLFGELFEADRDPAALYFPTLSALMQILSAEYATPTKSVPSQQKASELVKNVKDIILFNYTNPEFTINDAARILHISHAQMSRVFKEEMGVTPVSYLIEMRLTYASGLLHNNDFSVKKLCAASGFRDEHYFMKRFKSRFGMTISEYKKMLDESEM